MHEISRPNSSLPQQRKTNVGYKSRHWPLWVPRSAGCAGSAVPAAGWCTTADHDSAGRKSEAAPEICRTTKIRTQKPDFLLMKRKARETWSLAWTRFIDTIGW